MNRIASDHPSTPPGILSRSEMLGGDWSSVSLAARYHIQAIRALPDGATQAPAAGYQLADVQVPNGEREDPSRCHQGLKEGRLPRSCVSLSEDRPAASGSEDTDRSGGERNELP